VVVHCKYDELVSVGKLKPFEKNRNKHSPEQIERLAKLLGYQGIRAPIVVSKLSGCIVKGHGTLAAIKENGWKQAPVVFQEFADSDQEYSYVQSDNAIAEWAELDLSGINSDIGDLGPEFDVDMLGIKDFLLDPAEKETLEGKGSLSETFGVPPFSVLNAREGWWTERKRQWLAKGIKSEEGRGQLQTTVVATEWMKRGTDEGGSVFDPVLCELIYRWFSSPESVVLDPFAGGSVRGVVCAELNRNYIGVELRKEQVAANRKQAAEICKTVVPTWIEGDSENIQSLCRDVEADLVFSCPPYGDLEVYSDDPADISNMGFDKFRTAYFSIIEKTCSLLKENSFACFVVGDFRDKKGNYRNFVSETIAAFLSAGLKLYNEAILVTPLGSLPIRAGRQFAASRKLGKTHQNVLVFVKGNGKAAAERCGILADHEFELASNSTMTGHLDGLEG
jgi:hypothetical protein